jgi:hypothetical protein
MNSYLHHASHLLEAPPCLRHGADRRSPVRAMAMTELRRVGMAIQVQVPDTRRVQVRGRFFTCGWHSYLIRIKTDTGHVFFFHLWVT